MRKALFRIVVTLLMVFGFDAASIAQGSKIVINNEKCGGRIYDPKEVSFRPKISSKPTPDFSAEAIAHSVRGRVVLSAVLCRTGKVTDVQVIESLPFGMTEKAIKAARQIKFAPAEKDGRRISEVIRLEYNFGYIGERRPPAQEPIAGRLIETVEITGLRSTQTPELMAYLKTRPGEPYREEQVMTDLRSLLSLGLFDALQSSVRVEDGTRGGVNVVFELIELRPNQRLAFRSLRAFRIANVGCLIM
jgi:TonB family protein